MCIHLCVSECMCVYKDVYLQICMSVCGMCVYAVCVFPCMNVWLVCWVCVSGQRVHCELGVCVCPNSAHGVEAQENPMGWWSLAVR